MCVCVCVRERERERERERKREREMETGFSRPVNRKQGVANGYDIVTGETLTCLSQIQPRMLS